MARVGGVSDDDDDWLWGYKEGHPNHKINVYHFHFTFIADRPPLCSRYVDHQPPSFNLCSWNVPQSHSQKTLCDEESGPEFMTTQLFEAQVMDENVSSSHHQWCRYESKWRWIIGQILSYTGTSIFEISSIKSIKSIILWFIASTSVPSSTCEWSTLLLWIVKININQKLTPFWGQ